MHTSVRRNYVFNFGSSALQICSAFDHHQDGSDRHDEDVYRKDRVARERHATEDKRRSPCAVGRAWGRVAAARAGAHAPAPAAAHAERA